MQPLRGQIETTKWHRPTGRRLWTRQERNLEVYAGCAAIAHLLGGDAGYAIAAIGFGSGTGTPALTDTALTGPAYYRAVDSVDYVLSSTGPSQAVFTFSLNAHTPLDYGAFGLNVTEIGLFCNPGGVSFPAAIGDTGTPRAVWQASHTYNVGDVITDGTNIQECTAGGTSGSPTPPSWATAVGGTTDDGSTLIWTCRAVSTAPSILFARSKFSYGAISSASGFTSTWSITIPPGQVS
jgi:hypothetical protein